MPSLGSNQTDSGWPGLRAKARCVPETEDRAEASCSSSDCTSWNTDPGRRGLYRDPGSRPGFSAIPGI